MDSLKNLLQQKGKYSRQQLVIQRLQTYIQKKYNFKPQISLHGRDLIIYAMNAAQTTTLRLDWANLCQLSQNLYELKIKLANDYQSPPRPAA